MQIKVINNNKYGLSWKNKNKQTKNKKQKQNKENNKIIATSIGNYVANLSSELFQIWYTSMKLLTCIKFTLILFCVCSRWTEAIFSYDWWRQYDVGGKIWLPDASEHVHQWVTLSGSPSS